MTRKNQIGVLALSLAMTLPAMSLQRGKQGGGGSRQGGNTATRSSGSVDTSQQQGRRPGDWLRKNMNTPLSQQKQELENSEEFRKLPQDRQQKLLNQLNRFNSMTPQQKSRMLSHLDWLERLNPDQKKKARDLHDQFHALTPDRRIAVRRALFGMRDMNTDERRKNIESPQMKQQFNDHERQIIKGYTELGFPDQHAEDDGGGSPQEDM